ncbi:MAG: penicillin-binding protein [Ruminococcaceae bacterium]|nr:penicillin-binding protein [Oscillospiraceae bacterium]
MIKNYLKENIRPIICLALIAVFFVCFVIRLFNWQIIQGDYYREEVATTANYRLTSDDTRGEIVDVNGQVIEANTTTYSVIIDKLYINGDLTVNKVITTLFDIFSKKNATWIDTLPIIVDKNDTYQFSSDEDAEDSLEYLRSDEMLDMGVYSTADDYMEELIDRYDLEEYAEDKKLCRDIASVRCNMELERFSSINPYTFAKDLSEEMTAIVSEYSQSLPCIDISTVNKRICVDGTLMPHILGITGPLTAEEYEENKDKGYYYNDIIGKFGIEAAMEEYLRGEGGTKTVSKNSDGTVISVVDVEPAKPGNTVYLTIDKNLQQVANASLKKNIKAAQKAGKELSIQNGEKGYGEDCTAGAVVMLSVKDFSVLAASTYPTYDITKYNDGDYYTSLLNDKTLPLYDRAFNGSFAPGSVVKPGVALAALEEEVVSEYTPITCTRRYDYYPSNVVNCMGYHGPQDVYSAISHSCNYYFAEVGRLLGIDTMYLYMEKLGLGERTGLEIYESRGFLAGRDSSSWLPGNTVQAAIGQSDNTFTPVQLATYCATIANDGVRLRTHLISKVTSYDRQEVIFENDPEKPEVVEDLQIHPYNLSVVQTAMRQVVASESGTAYWNFYDYDIPIAAKTGTAENTGSDHTAFICYAPYDKPEVAIAVVLEHGAKGTYSMSVARDLLDAYFHPQTETQPTN